MLDLVGVVDQDLGNRAALGPAGAAVGDLVEALHDLDRPEDRAGGDLAALLDIREAVRARAPIEDPVVPVQLASGFQVVFARLIDTLLGVGFGAGVGALETLLFATPWRTRNAFPIDMVADWVHAHPDATLHGVVAVFLFGVLYNLLAGRRGGRTLGRWLTGTVPVRASGRGLSWQVLILRMVLSLISFGLLGAGCFWSLTDSQHRTWHDIIVGTVVVRRRVRLPTV